MTIGDRDLLALPTCMKVRHLWRSAFCTSFCYQLSLGIKAINSDIFPWQINENKKDEVSTCCATWGRQKRGLWSAEVSTRSTVAPPRISCCGGFLAMGPIDIFGVLAVDVHIELSSLLTSTSPNNCMWVAWFLPITSANAVSSTEHVSGAGQNPSERERSGCWKNARSMHGTTIKRERSGEHWAG